MSDLVVMRGEWLAPYSVSGDLRGCVDDAIVQATDSLGRAPATYEEWARVQKLAMQMVSERGVRVRPMRVTIVSDAVCEILAAQQSGKLSCAQAREALAAAKAGA